jgi:putative SOS response-associated peptidase YedK
MCGRFTQAYTWEQLVALYRLTMPPVNTQPSYNVCPTDQIDLVMLDQDGGRAFTRARWGLIPYWWSKPLKQLPATFNARSDGVATKPMFRDAFKKRRCIVPMSGFYEWRQMEDGKQPFFISAIDGGVLSCAGLWDTWNDREKGERIRSATLIVTEANPFMSAIHDRMPVFLPPNKFDAWLDGSGGAEMLTPLPPGMLRAWPVSRRVNSSKAEKDEQSLIEPIEPMLTGA